MFAKHRKRR